MNTNTIKTGTVFVTTWRRAYSHRAPDGAITTAIHAQRMLCIVTKAGTHIVDYVSVRCLAEEGRPDWAPPARFPIPGGFSRSAGAVFKMEEPTDEERAEAARAVVKIEYWWDRISRQWIIQAKDAEGNQVGAAGYAANKRTLSGAINGVQREHGGNLEAVRT